jgi:hypothetical protein
LKRRNAVAVALVIVLIAVTGSPLVQAQNFKRVGAIALPRGQVPSAAVIAEGFAYFGMDSGAIFKVRLSDFSVVDSVQIEELATDGISAAGMSPFSDYAYFAGGFWHIWVVRVTLSSFGRSGTVTWTGDAQLWPEAVLIDSSGFAYVSEWKDPGEIVKVDLTSLDKVASLILNAGDYLGPAAVIDPSDSLAYYGTWTNPGIIVKISVPDLRVVARMILNQGEGLVKSAAIETANGFAYFGTQDEIIKVRLSDLSRAGTISYPGIGGFVCAAADNAGFVYFGSGSGVILKIRTSDLSEAARTSLAASESLVGEPGVVDTEPHGQEPPLVIDRMNGYAYIGSRTNPGSVVQLELGSEPSTQGGSTSLWPEMLLAMVAVLTLVAVFAGFQRFRRRRQAAARPKETLDEEVKEW